MKASLSWLVIDSGSGLPCHFSSSGLGSNRSSWLGAPSMKQEDHVLRFGREVRRLGSKRIAAHIRGVTVARQKIAESDGPQATGAIAQEQAAAMNVAEIGKVHDLLSGVTLL